ncbi:MAG: transposase, partial [Candidatus Helarchaeota archaeon]
MKKKYSEIFSNIKTNYNKISALVRGLIPLERQEILIQVLIEIEEEIQELARQIRKAEEIEYFKFSAEYRIILLLIKAVFRLNYTHFTEIINKGKNPLLHEFLSALSESLVMSTQEFSTQEAIFLQKYKVPLETLAREAKQKYHDLLKAHYIKNYWNLIASTGNSFPYTIFWALESFNFCQFYPESILKWKGYYSPDLMLKTFIFMKLGQVPSIGALFSRINEVSSNKLGHHLQVGMNLGFYYNVPKIDKLYKYNSLLTPSFLKNIVKKMASILIQNGIVNIGMLVGDSTLCLARRDDPDIIAILGTEKGLTRCHKYQVITDSCGIPLFLVRRPGEEHDSKGFKSLEHGLLELKEMAIKHDKDIDLVILDAGYSGTEIFEFIELKLKAFPVIDINPGNSQYLKTLKEQLEALKGFKRTHKKNPLTSEKARNKQEKVFFEMLDKAEDLVAEILINGSPFEKKVAKYISLLSVKGYLEHYQRRPVIEGLFGLEKSTYYLLGRTDRQLPIKGAEAVERHGLFTILALQFTGLYNYQLLSRNDHLLRSLSIVKVKELPIY